MKNKYTILTLLASFAFIAGSMAGMNFILRIEEEQLLKGSGEILIESPVLAWQGYGNGADEKEKDADSKMPILTMEQIEDAVKCWNNRKGEILHNPVEGQLSMEEAVQAGEDWLAKTGFVKEEKTGGEVFKVKATLGMGYMDASAKTQLEPYYSFWTIKFANENQYIILYLNAVTGGVWGAEINLYEGTFSSRALYEFVESAGFQASEQMVAVNPQANQTIIEIEESNLCAKATQYSLAIAETGYYEIGQNSSAKSREVMIYKLDISENLQE
ncbi:MAG: hypothetical protein NC251_10615 [Lachnoclostridium sp.]|nr:hypothetical protein [Lachnospira sp.]MCM1248871.1 hypothetical protein [Lachnoclostridium sp.]